MTTYEWYQQLTKPSWAPPSYLFGSVWSFLYLLIAVSFGTVFYRVATKQIPWCIAIPFILDIVFNLAFTPLQFGLRSNFLAMIDIFLVLATLIWSILAIYPYAHWISYVQTPYLFWVFFATILQISITYLNI